MEPRSPFIIVLRAGGEGLLQGCDAVIAQDQGLLLQNTYARVYAVV